MPVLLLAGAYLRCTGGRALTFLFSFGKEHMPFFKEKKKNAWKPDQ
jgi:hypothetical protein